MQQNDMIQKQTYLRRQIIDKQYDPEKFIEFLNSRLRIGDDLSLCTFQQLKNVNQKYKQQESDFDSKQSAIKSETLIKSDVIEKPSSIKPRTISFEKYNIIEPEFTKTFQCIKINDRLAKGRQIHCEVGNPQRKNTGGFFGIGSTSFLEFEVRTIQMGWLVGRRYSDFVWLRQFLRKIYPTQIVPPIPQKKAAKRTQRHVQKRMKILQYFLNDVANIPEFLNNRYVQGFLKITDAAKLSQLKADGDKVQPNGTTSIIQTANGQVTVNFNESTKAYTQEMKKLVPQMQRLYKEVTRRGKRLQEIQTEQINSLYEMGNLFAQMHQSSREVLNRLPKSDGLAKLNGLYVTLNNMTIQWGNILRNQFQIIQKNVNTFFKYVRNDLHGYLQIFQAQQLAEQEFAKFKLALQKKKEKIYGLYDPSKWQLSKDVLNGLSKEVIHDKAHAFKTMLPKENVQLQKLRIKNSLYISQLNDNGNLNFRRSANKFQENFKEWSIKIKVNTQQLSELWGQMATSFSGGSKTQKLKQKPVDQRKGDEIFDD